MKKTALPAAPPGVLLTSLPKQLVLACSFPHLFFCAFLLLCGSAGPASAARIFTEGFTDGATMANWTLQTGAKLDYDGTINNSDGGGSAKCTTTTSTYEMYHSLGTRPFHTGIVQASARESAFGFFNTCGNFYRSMISLRHTAGGNDAGAMQVGYYSPSGSGLFIARDNTSTFTSLGLRNEASTCGGIAWVTFKVTVNDTTVDYFSDNSTATDRSVQNARTATSRADGLSRVVLGFNVACNGVIWWDGIYFDANTPAVPTGMAGTPNSTTAITWSATPAGVDYFGFEVFDSANASKFVSSLTARTTTFSWQETGLTANTAYARYIKAWQGTLYSTAPSTVTKYTLSVAPTAASVTYADSSLCPGSSVIWTAVGGFGAGTIQYYRYVFDTSPTHTWTGSETQWSSGTLTTVASSSGTWYLHVKGYNGDNVENGTFDYAFLPTVFTETMGTVGGTTAISAHESGNGFDNDAYTMIGTADVRNTTASSGYTGASGGANVFITTTVGTYFQIADINTLGLTSLQLSFGINKNTTTGDGSDLVVEVSSDGTTYSPLSFTALPTGAGTAIWHLRTATGTIPATSNLRIRFRQTGTATQYRIDDVKLQAPSASISISTPPANQTACSGSTATFSVVGAGSGTPGYSWAKHDNGGWGNAWSVSGSGTVFLQTSAQNENGGGTCSSFGATDINSPSTGKALGMYGGASGDEVATRTFTALSAGQVVSVDMDNGGVDSGRKVGFSLQTSGGADVLQFYFLGGQSNYKYNDGTERDTGTIGFQRTGLRVQFVLTSSSAYVLIVTPCGGTTKYFTGSYSGTIAKLKLFNQNTSGGDANNAYFNNFIIGGYVDNADNYSGNYSGQDKGDQPIASGNGGSSYTTPTLSTGDNGTQYEVVVYSCGGTVLSSTATLTVNTPATVNAGADQTVCASSPAVTLAGSFGGTATMATWTGGAGSFSPNNTTPTATYTPTAGEITAGTVTLTLTTDDPSGPCPSVNDPMTITIDPAATVSAGPDQTVCANSPATTLAGSFGAPATMATWTGGAGSFSPNNTTPTATYTPTAGEITVGTVTLTLTTDDPGGPCGPVNDSMTITIDKVTANTATYQRASGSSLKIRVSSLLTNVTDTDNETITLTSVGPGTASGTTVTTDGTFVFYTNSVPPNVSDSFTYYVSDVRGCLASGTVNISIAAASTNQTQNIIGIVTNGDNNVTITFAGIANRAYLVEATTNLNVLPGVWEGLTNNVDGSFYFTAGANGLWTHTDLNATNYESRFYRSARP